MRRADTVFETTRFVSVGFRLCLRPPNLLNAAALRRSGTAGFAVRQRNGLLVRRWRLATRIIPVGRLPEVIVAGMVVVSVVHVHGAATHVIDAAADVTGEEMEEGSISEGGSLDTTPMTRLPIHQLTQYRPNSADPPRSTGASVASGSCAAAA